MWNEATIDDTIKFHKGLIALMALDKNDNPYPVGTGFVVCASGSSAIACTSAYNLVYIKGLVSPRNPFEIIEVDTKRIRAICVDESGIDFSEVTAACWDRDRDICFLQLTSQSSQTSFFKTRFNLTDYVPQCNEIIALIGFAEMELINEAGALSGGWPEHFSVQKRLVLRWGRVSGQYPKGHLLCKGPCLESTIPTYHGMSGGPAVLSGQVGDNILPFGVLCSGFTAGQNLLDRSVPGSSTIALLQTRLSRSADGSSWAELGIKVSGGLSNSH